MNIHPTAIVSSDARIGEGVEIGPWSLVGPRCELGAGCVLGARVTLEHRVIVGEATCIGHGTIVGADPQSIGFDASREDAGVRIGRRNKIREYVTIHRATAQDGDTVLGDDNFLMTGCHIGHDSVLADGIIIANNVLLAGHVHVEDRVVFGGGTAIHQFVRVGFSAMVGGGCRFSKDIPPFLIGTRQNLVAGINSIGIRRAGFGRDVRSDIRRAFGLLYLSGHNVSQALAAAAEESWGTEATRFWEFVRAAKKRGVCDYIGNSADADMD